MFFSNKQRLFPLNNITILECNYFNISNFIDQTSQNFTQNFINNKSKKRNGRQAKKGGSSSASEEALDLNSNSILLEEEIANSDLNLRSISKNELLKKIFLYTNVNSKVNFLESERIICNTNFFKKNEIIFNNNKELIEKIFSEEFIKEINIIKRMTDRFPPSANRAANRENTLNFFEKIAQALKVYFKTEAPQRKKQQRQEESILAAANNNLNNVNSQASLLARQEFFLPKALSSQVFIIKPHQKTKIGPIVYSPSNYSVNSTATLFIKNNLTVLYPIKLKGHGGSGVLNFYLVNHFNRNKDINKDKYIETIPTEEKFERLIINIDSLEEIENSNGEITKEIKVKNTGNLPVKVNNITIKDSSCEGYGIKLSKCDGFLLKPEEHINFSISIFPDFNFYYLEKEILFETFHQTTKIKIWIFISEEILAQKNKLLSLSNFKGYGIFSLGASSLVILVILFIIKKEEFENKAAKAAEADKAEKLICFVSAKEIIEKKDLLKFENLFIRAYRKNNRAFYEEFFAKHMDAPTKHEVENLIADKRKKNLANYNNNYNYNIYSKNSAAVVENAKVISDDADKDNNSSISRGNSDLISVDKSKNYDKLESKELLGNESEGKEAQSAKAKAAEAAQKAQQGKKASLTAAGTKGAASVSTANKKAAAKKPYGITIKDNAQIASQSNNSLVNNNKKEDEKKTLHNILNSCSSNSNPAITNITNNNNSYSNANISNSQNLLPGSIYQTGSAKLSETQPKTTHTAKEDVSNIPTEYYSNQMSQNWGEPAFYQAAAMGFWPKNYQAAGGFANFPNTAAANSKRFSNQPNFDINSGYSAKNSNSFQNAFNSFPSNDDDKKNSLYPITPLNPEAPSFSLGNVSNNNNNFYRIDSKEDKNKSLYENSNNNNNTIQNDEYKKKNLNNEFNFNNNINSSNSNNNAASFANNFINMDFTGGAGEAPAKSSEIPNIKEQFMSFVPGFFTQDASNPSSSTNNNRNNASANFLNMNFIQATTENDSAPSAHKQHTENNQQAASASQGNASTIGNFKMIDFTNYFNNNQNNPDEAAVSDLNAFNNNNFNFNTNNNDNKTVNKNNIQNIINNNDENSDNEDLINLRDNDNESAFNENEYDYNNNKYNKHRSDREKLIEDSGTEERDADIKFNFNSIFGQNNMKLISNPSYNDFVIQDSEEPKENFDGNKPYFDKNLFFSFDTVFNNNGSKATSSFFNNASTGLFSANTKSTNLLSELRDDEHDEMNTGMKASDRWDAAQHNRLDDVAENDDDEDEEGDPEWNNEDVDVKKEGFFDASGNYKLKQMDFNFNLDFKARK